MRWPPNQAWTSFEKRKGYRHFVVSQFGGKGKDRWVELLPVLNKEILIRVPWSQLKNDSRWISGWLQIQSNEDICCKSEGLNRLTDENQ